MKHLKPLTAEKDWPMWKRKIRDILDYHEGALDVIDDKLMPPRLSKGTLQPKKGESFAPQWKYIVRQIVMLSR